MAGGLWPGPGRRQQRGTGDGRRGQDRGRRHARLHALWSSGRCSPPPESDIYALGATMHHLLTARDPRDRFTSFPELDMELLRSFSTFQPLSELRPDVSPAVVGIW